MPKPKTDPNAHPARTIKSQKDEQEIAARVTRFLALLPDTFDEIAEGDQASELSQLSFTLASWAEDALGGETKLHEAMERSFLELGEDEV